MDYELLEKAAMTKYEISKKDPFRFFIRSIVAGLYLGLATILSYTLAVLLVEHHVIAAKIAAAVKNVLIFFIRLYLLNLFSYIHYTILLLPRPAL